MAVIGLPCATPDIAPGVTKVSPVLGAVFMKLNEGCQDGDWHAKAGEGLCSGVPQMWQDQPFTHRDPQSPPAMNCHTVLRSCPSAPGAVLCLGCVGSPVEPHREGSMGQHRIALADKCMTMSETQNPVWVCLEDNRG